MLGKAKNIFAAGYKVHNLTSGTKQNELKNEHTTKTMTIIDNICRLGPEDLVQLVQMIRSFGSHATVDSNDNDYKLFKVASQKSTETYQTK